MIALWVVIAVLILLDMWSTHRRMERLAGRLRGSSDGGVSGLASKYPQPSPPKPKPD